MLIQPSASGALRIATASSALTGIGTVKRLFADTLCATLNLYRVSAPLFLEASTGLNDDLNGVERKVTFDIKDSGTEAQVVQSLAKWKRKALKDYGFRVGKGLYCEIGRAHV